MWLGRDVGGAVPWSAGSWKPKPKAAKVDEGWLESQSASSVSALVEPGPYGVGLRYGGQQWLQKQVVVCWGGGTGGRP